VTNYRNSIAYLKSPNIIPVLFIALFSCVVGLIAGWGYYSVLVMVLFCSIVLAILISRTEYVLYYYLVLGALTFPGALDRLGGLVTLNWARTTFLAVIYLLYSLFLVKNMHAVAKTWEGRRLLLGIFPWIGYLGITIIWAISPMDSMRYYPKFLMAAFLALSLMLDNRISSERCVKMLIIGAIIFLIVSTIAAPFAQTLWPGTSTLYFEGYSGRHPSKFYIVFVALLALSLWLVNKTKKLPIFIMIHSFIILLFIVQRAAILALVLGGLSVVLLSIKKISLSMVAKGILSLGLVILGIYVLFYTTGFQESMFKSTYGPSQFFTHLFQGDIGSALHLVRFKGRLELWQVARELQQSLLGEGFGTTPVYLKTAFGEYNELHNDMLQYLIETGYLGFALYLFMWLSLFRLGWKFRNSDDEILKSLGLSLCGFTVALFSWSFVSHVFDYTHVSGAYLFILAALIVKRSMEKARNASVQ